MFAPNWSVKGEYLYYDLGRLTYALSPLATTAGFTGPSAVWTVVAARASAAEIGVSAIAAVKTARRKLLAALCMSHLPKLRLQTVTLRRCDFCASSYY
jgi:hypothetical protein